MTRMPPLMFTVGRRNVIFIVVDRGKPRGQARKETTWEPSLGEGRSEQDLSKVDPAAEMEGMRRDRAPRARHARTHVALAQVAPSLAHQHAVDMRANGRFRSIGPWRRVRRLAPGQVV